MKTISTIVASLFAAIALNAAAQAPAAAPAKAVEPAKDVSLSCPVLPEDDGVIAAERTLDVNTKGVPGFAREVSIAMDEPLMRAPFSLQGHLEVSLLVKIIAGYLFDTFVLLPKANEVITTDELYASDFYDLKHPLGCQGVGIGAMPAHCPGDIRKADVVVALQCLLIRPKKKTANLCPGKRADHGSSGGGCSDKGSSQERDETVNDPTHLQTPCLRLNGSIPRVRSSRRASPMGLCWRARGEDLWPRRGWRLIASARFWAEIATSRSTSSRGKVMRQ